MCARSLGEEEGLRNREEKGGCKNMREEKLARIWERKGL